MDRPYQFDRIPHELMELPQWVLWGYQHIPGRPKPKKPTLDLQGKRTRMNDPRYWMDFHTAVEALQTHPERFSGIGFFFTDQDPYVGIDIDHGFDPVKLGKIIRYFRTYTEYSPSRTGVHLILKGKIPQNRKNNELGLETYDQGLYFTMTGWNEFGYPGIVEDAHKLQVFLDHYFPQEKPICMEKKGEMAGRKQAPSIEDQEVIRKAAHFKFSHKFSRLMGGDPSMYTRPDGQMDHSAADQALCNLLMFLTYGDAEQVERIFRTSGLMRPKWDAIHEAASQRTYGQITIQEALEEYRRRTGR